MRPSVPTIILTLLLAMPVGGLSAQTIRGTLLDDTSDEPISAATVTMYNDRGGQVTGVLTDSVGFFQISAPAEGSYMLRAERIGYRTTHAPYMDLIEGDSLEVEFRVSADAVFLAPITVTATSRPWWERVASPALWGFFERREQFERLGSGRFLAREDLERYDGLPMSAFLSTLPGVRMEDNDFGTYAVLRGGRGLVRPCQPEYFVDGMRMRLRQPDDEDFSTSDLIDSHVSVSGLEAAEIYVGASQLPAEFGGMSSNCGVVVLWTRRSL